MTRLLGCVAAAAALVAFTNSAPAVAKVEIVKTASPALARGSSFAWAATPAVGFGIPDPAVANEITIDRLRVTTETTLTAKGYRQVGAPDEADFLVSYTVMMMPTTDAELSASGCDAPTCTLPANASLDTTIHTDSLLVLDLTERRTGRLIWRATSKKRVTGKDASEQRLGALLREMTKSLPQ